MFDLRGKKALVTGGATGLGYHMSRALAVSGADVLIAARRQDILAAAADALNRDAETKGQIRYHPVDLADRESIETLARYGNEELGGIDIFIGNAGQDFNEHILDIKNESIDQIMQVNVSANVELIRAFLPHMKSQHWGRILFSSSVSTVVSSPHEGICMYTATKGALNALTRTLAAETGHDNITVNSLILGFFVTDMVREAQELLRTTQGEDAARIFMEDFVGMTALGRAGKPEELEGLIRMLASDAGSYITGTNLVVDGGMSVMLRPNGSVE